jgi:hypothetical protein
MLVEDGDMRRLGKGWKQLVLRNGVPVSGDFWVSWDGGRRGGKLELVLDLYIKMRC